MVKISVIIPVYNSAQYLPKCLESVCGQTLCDIEIICVNDCSSDNSLTILQEYTKNDKRIKLVDLKENKGAATARNIGMEIACGQYLGFVDSDDFIDCNFYEKLYEKAVESEADAVKGNLMIYCPKTKSAKKESWIDLNDNVRQHKANFYFSFTSAIYKTSFIKEKAAKFLEGLIHFEDSYFTIKAAVFYRKLEVIDDVFYYYVKNPGSSSRKKITINHIDSLIVGVGKVIDMLDEYCVDKVHYMIIFNFLLEQVLCWCNRIDVNDEINAKATSGLFLLYNRCRYKEECATYHFLKKKKDHKEEVIKQLRNKVRHDLKNS
ncbi:MAG: glycoslytransferase [Rickettsiaceae bacterium]|jgi:glycosyltransferase involved in cell wall biosynthesis|nr:glycoslytransferase [Rickettsiaceae bacterium]